MVVAVYSTAQDSKRSIAWRAAAGGGGTARRVRARIVRRVANHRRSDALNGEGKQVGAGWSARRGAHVPENRVEEGGQNRGRDTSLGSCPNLLTLRFCSRYGISRARGRGH